MAEQMVRSLVAGTPTQAKDNVKDTEAQRKERATSTGVQLYVRAPLVCVYGVCACVCV